MKTTQITSLKQKINCVLADRYGVLFSIDKIWTESTSTNIALKQHNVSITPKLFESVPEVMKSHGFKYFSKIDVYEGITWFFSGKTSEII